MVFFRLIATLMVAMVLAVHPGQASATDAAPQAESSPSLEDLQAAMVALTFARWGTSLIELQPWSKANQDLLGTDLLSFKPPDFDVSSPPSIEVLEELVSPFSSTLDVLRAAGLEEEFAEIVARHDFTIEEWSTVGNRFFRAFVPAQLERFLPVRDQMEQLINSLERLDSANPEKEENIAQIRKAIEVIDFLVDVPPGDLDIARSMQGFMNQDPPE